MQLRVARLCLDCEEVFVGDVCPICASERSAFLSSWLQVEERRRWRRPAPAPETAGERRFATVKQFFRNIFGDGTPIRKSGPPRTRRADQIEPMNFDGPSKVPEVAQPAAAKPEPLRSDVR